MLTILMYATGSGKTHLTYDVKIKEHRLTALAGYSALENVTRQMDGQADNVPYKAGQSANILS
jgi:hypothetical protein